MAKQTLTKQGSKRTLTVQQFIDKVNASHLIFGVTFIKKGNGELRKMQARMHVTKGVKGVQDPLTRKLEDQLHSVLTVYDMQKPTEDGKGAFRRINLAQLVSVKVEGTQYNWDNKQDLLIEV